MNDDIGLGLKIDALTVNPYTPIFCRNLAASFLISAMAALGTHTLTSVSPAFIRRIRYVFTRSAPVLAMPCILNKKIDVAPI